MTVVVACPKCQSKYQLAEKSLGKTIECRKCGTKFPAAVQQTATAAVAGKTAVRTSTAGSRYSDGASADELAKFGLDGPIRRQPDPSSESYVAPPKDILGNYAADPGFAAVQTGEAKVKGKAEPEGLEAIIDNPFANQARSTIPVSETSHLPGLGYASLKMAASIALTIGIVAAVCYVVTTGTVVYLAYLFWDFSPNSAPPAEPDFIKTLGLVNLISNIVFWIVSLVLAYALSMFTYQGYENLKAMGTKELSFGPAIAAFGWLIPLANLALPGMVMAELTSASRKPVGDQWRGKVSIKVWVWWGLVCLFAIGAIGFRVYSMLSESDSEEVSFESIHSTVIFSAGWLIATSILLIAAVSMFGILAFEIAANLDKAWPAARRTRQGTGKPAPSKIPFVYSGVGLVLLSLVLIAASVLLIVSAASMVDPTTTKMILVYGGCAIVPALAIAAGAIGVIHSIKAFR